MTKKTVLSVIAAAAIASNLQSSEAFAPVPLVPNKPATTFTRYAEETPSEAVFMPADAATEEGEAAKPNETLETVEQFGKGAAKAKRGKRKGGSAAPAPKAKAAASLAPEEIFYEGPPAITETLVPTVSILTVIGIVPAAASWARQAWVRYKITTRRIRVTSGIGGKDMAEIVWPDVTELRTAKRFFGDGDLVFFLRDGARFEMRNVPDFEKAIEFVLKQVDADVAQKYKQEGDVTTPN